MRPVLVVCAALAALAVVACGNKSATLEISGAAGTFSLVITGSADTIAVFENKVSSYVSSGQGNPGVNLTTVDGDQHTGPLVCQTDVTDNGVPYHVALYSTLASLTPALCAQIQASTGG
jgi:hypothetical protein